MFNIELILIEGTFVLKLRAWKVILANMYTILSNMYMDILCPICPIRACTYYVQYVHLKPLPYGHIVHNYVLKNMSNMYYMYEICPICMWTKIVQKKIMYNMYVDKNCTKKNYVQYVCGHT